MNEVLARRHIVNGRLLDLRPAALRVMPLFSATPAEIGALAGRSAISSVATAIDLHYLDGGAGSIARIMVEREIELATGPPPPELFQRTPTEAITDFREWPHRERWVGMLPTFATDGSGIWNPFTLRVGGVMTHPVGEKPIREMELFA